MKTCQELGAGPERRQFYCFEQATIMICTSLANRSSYSMQEITRLGLQVLFFLLHLGKNLYERTNVTLVSALLSLLQLIQLVLP